MILSLSGLERDLAVRNQHLAGSDRVGEDRPGTGGTEGSDPPSSLQKTSVQATVHIWVARLAGMTGGCDRQR